MEAYVNTLINKLKLNESLISSILGAGVVIIIGFVLYSVFSSRSATTSTNSLQVPPDTKLETSPNSNTSFEPSLSQDGTVTNLPQSHPVAEGETLWSIAEKYYGSGYNWVDIAKENDNLNDSPDFIEPGQNLRLPQVTAKQKTLLATSQSVAILAATNGNNSLTINDNSYTVQKGDSLWNIAVRAYGDGYQWPKLYEGNRETVGANPNLIEPDTALSIPRD